MTREEAIRELKADYCGNRIICELYPDQCNREDCEIWWAITALENAKNDNLTPESAQNVPNRKFKMQKSDACSDTISRQAAIDVLHMDTSIIPYEKAREYADATILEIRNRLEKLPTANADKYEYHYDHTDCIWYRPEARNRCPAKCAQYRDGWNDAMNYIFRDGKGYRPYRRDESYGE